MAEAIERLAGGMTHIEAGWSTCMAERGHEVSDPVNYLPADFDIGTPEPSPAEVDMALVDVECQKSTDLVQVWFEVDSEIQLAMLGERADVFAQIARENEELLRRATGVVEGAEG